MRCRPEEVPDCRTEQGDNHHGRHEYGGDFIRQLADFRFAALRLAHHADDTGKRCLAADGAGGKQNAAVLDHGTGMQRVAIRFLLWNRFAGQHRLIQPGFALAYHSVNRNPVAGGQTQGHPRLNVGQRHAFFTLFADNPRRRWRQVEQFFQRF